MSIGDLSWYLDLRNPQGPFGSSQRDEYDRREKDRARRERLKIDRENREQEYNYLLGELGLVERQATSVSNITGDGKDRDARRQIDTNDANAKIFAGRVLPAQTQSQIQIAGADSTNKGKLITTLGDVSRGIQKDGITLRSNAAKDFFPLVTDQITKIQAAPVDLARSAIASQEMMAEKDRAFVKELWHLQNPKLGFGERFIGAVPGLAAAALLAFS